VVDDEAGYALSKKTRRKIAMDIGKRYAIDEWVTEGSSRLMRLPYSLNGIVSRICMIIKEEKDLEKLDPRTSELVVPAFAKSS
jgi:DNA primase catalytic subunit